MSAAVAASHACCGHGAATDLPIPVRCPALLSARHGNRRCGHGLFELQPGKVVAAGVADGTLLVQMPVLACEVLDVATGTWSGSGSLPSARSTVHQPGGAILMAGRAA